jgi:putative restriction endonuclease
VRDSADDPGRSLWEAAHIRALGFPHNGPAVLENLLCLCPNDHVLFDAGAIYIDHSYGVRESATHTSLGALTLRAGHTPITTTSAITASTSLAKSAPRHSDS